MTTVTITIKNGDKYRARKDISSTTWFRLDNDFWADPCLYDHNNDVKLFWLYVISKGSKAMSHTFEFSCDLAASNLRFTRPTIKKFLNILESIGKIELAKQPDNTSVEGLPPHTRHVDGRHITLHNTTEHNITEQNITVKLHSPKKGVALKKTLADEADHELAKDWLTFARTEMAWMGSKWSESGFAEAIATIRLRVGLNDFGMREVFKFIQADEFWRKVAVSPMNLLTKSQRNGNRKIDNILISMKRAVPQEKQTLKTWAES